MINPKTVYVKTAKGQEEIDRRTHKLPLKLRSLLIMINGKVTAGEIVAYGGALGGGMEVLLAQLLEGGFIEPAPAPGAGVAPPPVAAPAGDERQALVTARNSIRKLVYDQLGPDADMVVAKLEKCETRVQLATYCDTCKDIVEAALGKAKGQMLWTQAKEAIEQAFAACGDMAVSTPVLSQAAPPPAKPAPSAPAAAPRTGMAPKREVEQWMFEKARGEISRLVFDSLGPDGEMLAMRIEKSASMAELKDMNEKIYEVMRGMRGKKPADDVRSRIDGLIAAVEGG